VGVSNETSWGVCQFAAAAKAHGLPKIVSIQNSYSLIYRGAFETDLAEVRLLPGFDASAARAFCRIGTVSSCEWQLPATGFET